jgi:RNA polymerase sigma-70 factor (ECF subfamily)
MCRDLEREVGVTMSSGETRVSVHPDFEHVYGEFHQRIQRYLTRLLGASEADDVTQEVFAKVSQTLPRFRGESSISTWIYRIATNTAYDRLRSPSFRRADVVPLEHTAPVHDPSSGIDQALVRTEMNECIDEYIARLPASYRSVVILSEHEGLTNQEIADALGVSLDTVKIRLHRARARLRQELGSGCSFYRDDRNEFACQPKARGVSPHD